MKLEEIKAFAINHGYDDVLFLEKWNGFDVYEPLFNGSEVTIVGLPFVILVKGNQIRISTAEEAFKQLDEH